MKRLAIILALGVSSLNAHAVDIAGLYSTGAGLSAGDQDMHYALSSSTDTVGSYGYVASNNSFPIGPWLSNTATSAWLTPLVNQAQSFDPSSNGTFTWTTTFDLTGYNASTASFTAEFAADNSAQAYLNGNLIGTASGFSSWSALSANGSDFVSGLNTLTFVVTNLAQNGGNPTGLQFNLLASNVSAVPEPSEYGLIFAGLGMISLIVRRKKSA